MNDNVLYHSLLRLASPQQVWGSLSEMGTDLLKWIATTKCTEWHSWTLARLALLTRLAS